MSGPVIPKISLRGLLKGHNGWVTSVATTAQDPNMVITGSRDKNVIQWDLTKSDQDTFEYGKAKQALHGHAHFVEDVVISADGQFALSGSCDKTLRLWELKNGTTTRRFPETKKKTHNKDKRTLPVQSILATAHSKDVLSVAFSVDNRQIVSGSRDRSIKLWNTLGECKFTIEDAHNDWVSCVRFSPNTANPIIVSAGWDKVVKVWSWNCHLEKELVGHTGHINTLAIAPDGSLCASGGKDGIAMLWDLKGGEHLYSLEAGSTINALCFSPLHYWLLAGCDNGEILIWDLKFKKIVARLSHEDNPDFGSTGTIPSCLSLTCSADGRTIFAGYTDSLVRVWALD